MYISTAFNNLMMTKDKVALSETDFGIGPRYSCLKCYVMKFFQCTKS